MRALLDAGANVNTKMETGLSALQIAVCGRISWSSNSVEGVPFGGTTSRWRTINVHPGAGNADCVNLLLKAGAKVDDRDSLGGTALIYAAAAGRLDCVQALLAGHADVNAVNLNGRSALEFALYSEGETTHSAGSYQVFKMGSRSGSVFTSGGHNDCAAALVMAGADVNLKDDVGRNALMEAAIGGNTDGVKLLIAAKADLNATDHRGKSAMTLAKSQDIADLLKSSGASK